MMIESIQWSHPIFYISTFVLGCFIGSYLNAVIYRLPRGLSTSDPKRSFCPICKKPIPIWRNIPLFTWLAQRGKCAECDAPIPVRYFLVELLTGLVWLGSWWFLTVHREMSEIEYLAPVWYPGALALFVIVIATICVVITFIDIEHLIIPQQLTIGGSVVALIAAATIPWHWGEETWLGGLKQAGIGGIMGFATLWLVVLIGKLLFGRQKVDLEKPLEWHVADAKGSDDPNDNVSLVLDGENNYWHELFYRKSDKLKMQNVSDLKVNGEEYDLTELIITRDEVHVGEKSIALEDLKSMSGKVQNLVIPREAMGMGDVHLLGMLGLCLGVQSLIFIILASCGVGILIHLFARAGFGKQMPFGPSIIIGAALWVICGPDLVDYYIEWINTMAGV